MAELKRPCGCGDSKAAPAQAQAEALAEPRASRIEQEVPGVARLLRTARTAAVPGVGYARRGVIHTVPDSMVDDLLESGEWERVDQAAVEPQRVTEPAPSQPAAKAKAKPKGSKRKR